MTVHVVAAAAIATLLLVVVVTSVMPSFVNASTSSPVNTALSPDQVSGRWPTSWQSFTDRGRTGMYYFTTESNYLGSMVSYDGQHRTRWFGTDIKPQYSSK